jgi:hypothetical protein
MIKAGLIKEMDDDLHGISVDPGMWRKSTPDMKEVTVRRFADYRQLKKGDARVAIYDFETGRELASYSPLKGPRFR